MKLKEREREKEEVDTRKSIEKRDIRDEEKRQILEGKGGEEEAYAYRNFISLTCEKVIH